MANSYFNAVYYLQNNPDVWAAGYTVDTAWNHYVQYGAFEANAAGGLVRAPNPWFDVQYYLTANPDLIANGVTPATALDHFLTYGSQMGEDRAPNSAIAAAPITEASLLAYALANEDLQKAFGIAADATELTVAQQNQLVNQFYSYGYNESRPDAPAPVNPNPTPVGSTFTLTAGNDYADGVGSFVNGSQFITNGFKFTGANETVAASNLTLNSVVGNNDTLIDVSTSDSDVLNVSVNAALANQSPTIQNIETIAFNVASNVAPGAFNFASVTGAKTVTASGASNGVLTLNNLAASGVTTIDASGLNTNASGINATFAASTSTAALTLTGGTGADVFIGGLGNDTINGGAGADRLIGGAGADTINGGAGADVIDGGTAADTLNGGGGGDVIIAGAGDDTVAGGGGADAIALGSVAVNAAALAGAGYANVAGGAAYATPNGGVLVNNATGVSAAGNVPAANTLTYNGDAVYANGQITATFTETVTVGGAVVATYTTTTSATAANITAAVPLLTTNAAGSNTVVFESTVTDNGNDNVTGFNMGPIANGGDVLNVSAFLGTAVSYTEVATGDGPNQATDANVVVVTNNTWANAAAEGVTLAANQKYVIVEAQDATPAATENANVYFATTDGAGNVALTVAGNQVATLIGVQTDGTGLLAFVDANFA